MASVTSNAVSRNGTGLGAITTIVTLSKTNMTQAELDAALQYITDSSDSGTNDAFSIAGVVATTPAGAFVSGTTDAVHVAIQGSGTFTAASNYGIGSTGVTSAVICTFDQ